MRKKEAIFAREQGEKENNAEMVLGVRRE